MTLKTGKKDGRTLIVLLVAAITAMVALIAWQLLDGSETTAAASEEARIISPSELAAVSGDVFWAGSIEGSRLEFSRPDPEHSLVRYLTGDAEPGDGREEFLTVGTYRMADASQMLERQAERDGGQLEQTEDGEGTIYHSQKHSQSAYLAFPDSDIQVEVYAPSAGLALELIRAGKVQPAGGDG